ncbi:MAG: hypothetical protein NZ480_07725 [Bdellovibrionaceae bacterium]|nr:hypothetical protein [Pseudobdellovibrionaceae bacterium]
MFRFRILFVVLIITKFVITFGGSWVCFASKARVKALEGASLAHLIDPQTIFMNPAHILLQPKFVTFESGAVGSGAEGGFVTSLEEDTRIGIYLGYQNRSVQFFNTVTLRESLGLSAQRNPVEFFWGQEDHAFALSVSRFEDSDRITGEMTLVGKYGLVRLNYELWAHIFIFNEAKKALNQAQLKNPGAILGGRYRPDEGHWQYFGQLYLSRADHVSQSLKFDAQELGVQVGLEHASSVTPRLDWYYGVRLDYFRRQSSQEAYVIVLDQLPLFLGAEIRVTDVVVFRASVTQNFLYGVTKLGNSPEIATSSNTRASLGIGLKLDEILVDGYLEASTNGQMGSDPFVSLLALTYSM